MEELHFLRAEVAKLERIIESSAEARAAMARQAQMSQRNARACQECLEMALSEAGGARAWEALRTEPPDLGLLGRAALTEMRALALDAGIPRNELTLTEAERSASREVEAYALSVARSYRGFASQGAARLDEVRERLRVSHGRMQHQLDDVRAAALLAMRRRAMRSLLGLRWGLAARVALSRWQQAVAMEKFTSMMAVQLHAAARQEEAEIREQRWQIERRSRADRAHAAVLERDVARAQAEAGQLEPLKQSLAASQRETSATQARLREARGEIDTLKAEVQLLRRALQDERRVSALRMQAERRLAEAEQGQGALQQELGALSAELMRAASLDASSGLMLRS